MWNYRVVRKKHIWRHPDTQEEQTSYSYGIHEAYYDQQGNVGMITQEAVEPYGETIEELRHAWVMMAEAFGQPLLDDEQIPEPGYDRQYDILAASCETDTGEVETIESVLRAQSDEERKAHDAAQEQQRQQTEETHQHQFVGTPTLKELIERLYADYAAAEKKCNGTELSNISEIITDRKK
ncbi:hypothetical protein U14_01616 [Candidatus Moduliflexus flocculans]|uniref:Uncharacterized protein n=1 Tax=Candidatus Moduliflexus flocculans TaxID=1499966 RepID=A0A0S6VSP4_9BACT|nr:hypothetical protein U14_01616 [Candidatus Moduliflexus flocculans]